MIRFRADLHVHTVLSPCAGRDMLPEQIVKAALFHEINLIAITDHNASQNAAAVISVAEEQGLLALRGMELQTIEEIHSDMMGTASLQTSFMVSPTGICRCNVTSAHRKHR